MKLKNENLKVNQIVWITDYRYNEISHNKPLRHIEPTKVIVKSNDELPKNKTVYYSDTHFRPLQKDGTPLKKVIAPYDNTGFRAYTGTCMGIFDNKEECIIFFQNQCDDILDDLETHKKEVLKKIDTLSNSVKEYKNMN